MGRAYEKWGGGARVGPAVNENSVGAHEGQAEKDLALSDFTTES
jgi:hypothetical protein